MLTIFTVKEIAQKISTHCSTLFPFVWVEGEVSNLFVASNGALYFSLKDDTLLLDAVWFFSSQKQKIGHDRLTGEVLAESTICLSKTIKNGDYIYCAGTISIYKERSKYQLIVDLAEYSGKGAYSQAFIILRDRLALEGLFSPHYKKNLPKNPKRVFLITSKYGAAIQDFLHTAKERGCGSSIELYTVAVQGKNALKEIIEGIQYANSRSTAEMIVLIRGGGAGEDLAIFNEESLVRAIFASSIPIITGIGHEIDMSLSDLVADTYGITPTAVAQKIWEEKETIYQKIYEKNEVLFHKILLLVRRQELLLSYQEKILHNFLQNILNPKKQEMAFALRLLEHTSTSLYNNSSKQLEKIGNDIKRLGKQYCIFSMKLFIQSIDILNSTICIKYRTILLQYIFIKKKLEKLNFVVIISEDLKELELLLQRMNIAFIQYLQKSNHILKNLIVALELLSPINVLERGYVIVEQISGDICTSVKELNEGIVHIRFKDGIAVMMLKG